MRGVVHFPAVARAFALVALPCGRLVRGPFAALALHILRRASMYCRYVYNIGDGSKNCVRRVLEGGQSSLPL